MTNRSKSDLKMWLKTSYSTLPELMNTIFNSIQYLERSLFICEFRSGENLFWIVSERLNFFTSFHRKVCFWDEHHGKIHMTLERVPILILRIRSVKALCIICTLDIIFNCSTNICSCNSLSQFLGQEFNNIFIPICYF